MAGILQMVPFDAVDVKGLTAPIPGLIPKWDRQMDLGFLRPSAVAAYIYELPVALVGGLVQKVDADISFFLHETNF